MTRYRRDGRATTLPSLQTGRRDHACGLYIDDNNRRVSNYCNIVSVMFMSIMLQILLVTGGWNDGYKDLSSTEILSPGASRWTWAASLPRAVYGIR